MVREHGWELSPSSPSVVTQGDCPCSARRGGPHHSRQQTSHPLSCLCCGLGDCVRVEGHAGSGRATTATNHAQWEMLNLTCYVKLSQEPTIQICLRTHQEQVSSVGLSLGDIGGPTATAGTPGWPTWGPTSRGVSSHSRGPWRRCVPLIPRLRLCPGGSSWLQKWSRWCVGSEPGQTSASRFPTPC